MHYGVAKAGLECTVLRVRVSDKWSRLCFRNLANRPSQKWSLRLDSLISTRRWRLSVPWIAPTLGMGEVVKALRLVSTNLSRLTSSNANHLRLRRSLATTCTSNVIRMHSQRIQLLEPLQRRWSWSSIIKLRWSRPSRETIGEVAGYH